MNLMVLLVGCGNMGHAMLKGWIASGRLLASEVGVVEPSEALRQRAAELGVRAEASAAPFADQTPRIVLLAVKPQVIRTVAAEYRSMAGRGSAFLSVAAGVGIATFEEILGAGTPIVRCMPNTPAAIGKGMMVTVANAKVDKDTAEFVRELLAASGEVAEIPSEGLMDAVTAVSGSGPAYIFHFIEALAAAGTSVGLPRDVAEKLARQTVYGSACLAFESGEDAGKLREQVTSPNGTTAAALGVLMGDKGLTELLSRAVEAARARGEELGKAG